LQAILELVIPDERFKGNAEYEVYGHGGALFGFITSLIFLLVGWFALNNVQCFDLCKYDNQHDCSLQQEKQS